MVIDIANKKVIKEEKKRIAVKRCLSCPSITSYKPINMFYKSKNPLHSDGYMPICKECVANAAYDFDKHQISIRKLRGLMRQLDKPYAEIALQAAIVEYDKSLDEQPMTPDHNRKIVNLYVKYIQSMKQFKDWTWEDGEKWATEHNVLPGSLVKASPHIMMDENDSTNALATDDTSKNIINDEMVMLFGEGFSPEMYRRMMRKFNWLKESYVDVTNFHTEALATYTRYKVLEEVAIAGNDATAAQKWGGLANKAAENAKINPKQMSRADLDGGLNSFSELAQAIEQAVDVVPILPQFKYKPNDAVDFIIWQYINYARRLEDKPECDYEDVYHFYDEKVAAYIEMYGDPTGIFTNDPTVQNREQVKKFIKLPNDDAFNAAGDVIDDAFEPEEVVLGD